MSKLAIVLCAVLFASAAYSHPSPFMKRDISHAVTNETGQGLAAAGNAEVANADLSRKNANFDKQAPEDSDPEKEKAATKATSKESEEADLEDIGETFSQIHDDLMLLQWLEVLSRVQQSRRNASRALDRD